jgi:hypothetical protein
MNAGNTTTLSSTALTSTAAISKKKRKKVAQKQSKKGKADWPHFPSSDLLLIFINETFLSKVKKSSQLPINDFFNHYNEKLNRGWIEPIVGNLTPFITFLSSSSDQNNDTITAAAISFFRSKLNEMPIQSNYQQTKKHLAAAVEDSFVGKKEGELHPIIVFLTSDNEVKHQYNKDGWLLYLIGSKEAGKKRKSKLEYNVRIIATILYSILCNTCDPAAIDVLARSLGASTTQPKHRRRYLNLLAHQTIQEYFEIQHTDDSTATTASLSQSSSTNTDRTIASTASITQSSESTVTDTDTDTGTTSSSIPHHRQAPTVITTNIEKDSSNFTNNDNISPLTIPPYSPTTSTTMFSFTSSPNNTHPDWDAMSIGSPAPKQQLSVSSPSPFSSPTPHQAKKKKNRVGPTPNLKTPRNKRGNSRVLFTNNSPSTAATTTVVVTATASTPAPSSVSERERVVLALASASAASTMATPRTSPRSSRHRRRRSHQTVSSTSSNRASDMNTSSPSSSPSSIITIDTAKFRDDPVVIDYFQRSEKATNIKQLINGAVDFISSIASSNNSNIASVTSQYNMLLKVAKPRKLKEDSKPSSRRRYIRNKSKEIHNILSAAIPDSDIIKDVLSHILKRNYSADVYFDKVKQQHVSVADCIAIRMRGGFGISNNAVNKMLQDVVRIFKHNNMLRVTHPLPGSLRAKMGREEGKGTIPVDYQVIRCSTAKDKTEMCVHNWIKTIPLLVEKLVAKCIAQGRYEDSILFSKLVNKILLGIGADRGGGDLINLIRLLNRMDGNCAKYSIPLAVVEKAAEEYAVLAKTLYNKRGKRLLEPLLNDELHMFVMRFANDTKCLAVRFIRDGKPSQPNIVCVEKECERMVDGFAFDSIANTRKMWNDFDISNIMDNTEIDLQLNLMTNVKGHFIGVRVRSNGGTSLTHRFDSTVIASKFESVDCMQVISIPIEDAKVSYCVLLLFFLRFDSIDTVQSLFSFNPISFSISFLLPFYFPRPFLS